MRELKLGHQPASGLLGRECEHTGHIAIVIGRESGLRNTSGRSPEVRGGRPHSGGRASGSTIEGQVTKREGKVDLRNGTEKGFDLVNSFKCRVIRDGVHPPMLNNK